ncbi:hypothetical protein B4U79_08699 [Dinothrombium tinctorium]|uniref:Carboxylesterase type B domain-containing protein n=1 Tax=Dinothrombium tinctorium TaxID=1965070 RepID=A0A3S3P984_9ACAR|nr:hypothetical protein B4U79_08699 [Dinothrombium tinctorium]
MLRVEAMSTEMKLSHLFECHLCDFFHPFAGVPYASPPVGKLRFMPPVTSAHWSGVRSAHTVGPVCPQNLPEIKNETEALKKMTTGRLNVLKRLLPLLQNQSEDCLYLNIYAPAIDEDEEIEANFLN